jgi:hypothetical protein
MAQIAEPLLPTPLPTKDSAGAAQGAVEEVQRYYQIAGMTLGLSADLEIADATFAEKFLQFEVPSPIGEVIRIHHISRCRTSTASTSADRCSSVGPGRSTAATMAGSTW